MLDLGACRLARLKCVSRLHCEPMAWRDKFRQPAALASAHNNPTVFMTLLTLTSNQVGLPAELKHINKRRKRN